MIGRVLALIVLLWALGFALFVVALPGAADARRTDAIVVLTGGPGRIARGIELLGDRKAKRLLISGVPREVRSSELAVANHASPAVFRCCVDLGHQAVDTRSNAEETVAWLARRKAKSVRLVTTDWHMPRARFELERVLDDRVTIVVDAVESEAEFTVLLREYNKYLLRRAAGSVGL